MPGSFPTLLPTAPPRSAVALIPGVREWVLLVAVALALFGQAAFRPGRLVARWAARPRRRGLAPATGSRWVVAHWVPLLWSLAVLTLVLWIMLSWSVVRAEPARSLAVSADPSWTPGPSNSFCSRKDFCS